MNHWHWFVSPLAGTAAVLAGLSVLAIPLRQLTTAAPIVTMPGIPAVTTVITMPAVLRLRLLAPASKLSVTTTTGVKLLDLQQVAAGESEHDVMIPLEDGGLEVTLRVDCGAGGGETAVFLTILPDAYDEQTRYAIGHGRIEELLRYAWRSH